VPLPEDSTILDSVLMILPDEPTSLTPPSEPEQPESNSGKERE
jgi:hypothetical protein